MNEENIREEIEREREKLRRLEEQAKIAEFQRKADENPLLREYGKTVVSGGWHNFLVGFFVLMMAFGVISLVLLASSGKFQSIINEGDVNVQPLLNPITNNNYTFNTSTEVQNDYQTTNNFTIINYVNCNST